MKQYFSHDYNARNDFRITLLTEEFGMEGYGVFWALVEILHEADDAQISTDQLTIRALSMQLKTDAGNLERIIRGCVEYGLFYTTDTGITSKRVQANMAKRQDISKKRSEAAKMSKSEQTEANASKTEQAEANEGKGEQIDPKEKKEKEKKETIDRAFDEFWDAYHQKTGKSKSNREPARKHWHKLTDKDREEAVNYIDTYVATQNRTKDPEFYKLARTYLSGKEWLSGAGEVAPFDLSSMTRREAN